MWAVHYLEDDAISLKCKGLLAIMEHKGKAMTLDELLPISKDGYTSIQGGLQELSANGYYYSKPIRDSKGKYIEFEQNVRFTINRPVLHVEKNILHYLWSHSSLSDIAIDIIQSSAAALSSVEENKNELLKEINECIQMGFPNAEKILKIVKRKFYSEDTKKES